MTLIEMMVAMLIGTILVAGAITVYVQSKRNYLSANSVARLQDNLRFALETMEPDIRLSGFWGMHADGSRLRDPAPVTISCTGGSNAAATALALGRLESGVQAWDDSYTLPCNGTAPRDASDVLLVRHASARTTVPSPGRVQVAVNPSGGQLFDNGVAPAISNPSEIRDVVVHIYYIGASSFDPATPALRRLRLADGGAAGRLEDQEIIPGIENMQVQFGLDSDGNGEVERYVDSNDAAAVAGARIVAIRLWLLVRSDTSEAGIGFVDNASYQPADANLAPITAGADYPADFRRIAVSKTIFLRNGVD